MTFGGQLIVWDTTTGKERWRANARDFGFDSPAAAYGVRTVAFCADGTQFYTPGRQNEVIVWDTLSGHHEALPIESANQRPIGRCRSVDITPDAQMIAVGSADGVLVCDEDRQVLYSIPNSPAEPLDFDVDRDRLKFHGHYSLARFSPDAKMLAAVTSDTPDTLRLFESDTGRELRRLTLKARLVRFTFSPDGKQIATTERDRSIRLYDVESAKEIWSHVVQLNDPYENYTSAIAFSPDAKSVAACATDYRIYLIDAATGKETNRLVGHTWYPWALAFTADSKKLYSSGWDGSLRCWDVAACKQVALPAGVRATGIVAASHDGQTLAYGDDSGSIRLVDAQNAGERQTLELPGARYTQLAFSPDGRQLAGGGPSGDKVHVTVWDVSSGNVVHHWEWPKGRDPHSTVESLAFTPNGDRLAAAVFRQSSAYVWDLTTGQRLVELQHSQIYGLSFSPDGKTLATAGWDSLVRFWNSGTWDLDAEFDVKDGGAIGRDPRMYTVCYAPEGGLIATAHLDGNVCIWQADNMALRKVFQLEGRFVFGALSFSPDGLWLATGSMAGNVTLWDPLAGKMVWDLGRHQDHVYMVGFGRDARKLLSGGTDGVSYLWDLRPPTERSDKDLERLWNDLAGEDSAAAWQAMWDLSDAPEGTVAFLTKKLRPVKYVIDPDRTAVGLTAEESQRLEGLKKRLLDKEKDVDRSVTVRRALSLLAQSDRAEALRSLKELADQDPDGDMRRLVESALKRFGGLEKH